MKRCWLEGQWRAYCDGELPPEEMVAAARHLEECPACEALHREVAARAGRVSAWLSEVETLEESRPRVELPSPVRGRRWMAAAVAAIAAVAIAGLWLWPRANDSRTEPPARQAPRPTVQAVAPPAPTPAAPARAASTRTAHGRVNRPPRRAEKTQRVDYFMALDNDPLESGVIVRVALDGSGNQADVLFDSMGRPRAVRAVN